VFIVGAGLSRELESRQMTVYSLALPAGQIVGGVAIAATADWSDPAQFWMASVVMGTLLLVVVATTKEPQRRIQAHMDRTAARPTPTGTKPGRTPIKAVLWSTFGVFLLVHVLSSFANYGVNNQISNIFPSVYGISEEGTSSLIALAGLINIVLFFVAGNRMARKGAVPVYVFGNVLRLTGALGMALVGWLAGSAIVLAVGFTLLLYQGNPFCRVAESSTSVGFAPVPAGAANGWLIAAAAAGGFGGSLLGGVLAGAYGFNAINWMAAIAAAIAVLLCFVVLLPAFRRHEYDERAEPEPGAGARAATSG
jgi:predicted MFS family arabinose efflux permease